MIQSFHMKNYFESPFRADIYMSAMREARLDGKNPTKLMTKTLAQVSAIAAPDVNILDDDNLAERLRALEWLLLAEFQSEQFAPIQEPPSRRAKSLPLCQFSYRKLMVLLGLSAQLRRTKSGGPEPRVLPKMIK